MLVNKLNKKHIQAFKIIPKKISNLYYFFKSNILIFIKKTNTLISSKGRKNHLKNFPKIDIYENNNLIILKIELPNVNRQNILIDINKNHFTLTGEKKNNNIQENYTCHQSELKYGEFSRTIMLTCEVNSNSYTTLFDKGVLTVNLEKIKKPMVLNFLKPKETDQIAYDNIYSFPNNIKCNLSTYNQKTYLENFSKFYKPYYDDCINEENLKKLVNVYDEITDTLQKTNHHTLSYKL